MKKQVKSELHSGDIELALARHLNVNQNVIVPNISWGLHLHEIDLLVLTQSGYAWEIEIKISLSDLKADKKKHHQHFSNKIKRLYFAVPIELQEQALTLIPERAGLFVVGGKAYRGGVAVQLIKAPQINIQARPFNPEEINHLYKLATLRMWNLKEIVYRLCRELNEKKK